MTMKPPSWAKNAIPTPNGWRDPRTNELLKSQSMSQEQIDSYMGVTETVSSRPVKPAKEEVVSPPKPMQLNEAPANNKSLEDMTKLELEAHGRTMGVELDRRKNKEALIEELEEIIDDE